MARSDFHTWAGDVPEERPGFGAGVVLGAAVMFGALGALVALLGALGAL